MIAAILIGVGVLYLIHWILFGIAIWKERHP